MKKLLGLTSLFVLALAFVPNASAGTITFDFANTNAGSGIRFAGGNFTFNKGFKITTQSGTGWPNGTPLSGLTGSISGTYAIGTITTSGPVQSASVTGSGTFTIDDGLGNNFTATVTWLDIYTLGATGGINSGATINLTNLAYSGTNADLITLANSLAPSATITFQFSPARTLTQLKGASTSAPIITSYSGSVHADTRAVPEPSTLLLLGSGLVGLALIRFRK